MSKINRGARRVGVLSYVRACPGTSSEMGEMTSKSEIEDYFFLWGRDAPSTENAKAAELDIFSIRMINVQFYSSILRKNIFFFPQITPVFTHTNTSFILTGNSIISVRLLNLQKTQIPLAKSIATKQTVWAIGKLKIIYCHVCTFICKIIWLQTAIKSSLIWD